MIKYFFNSFFDVLYGFKNYKKQVALVIFLFVLGLTTGVLFKIKLCTYNWFLTQNFFNCFVFLLCCFVITSLCLIILFKSKRFYFLVWFLLFARGFCFYCTLRHVFFSFSFFKSILIFLTFLVAELLILLQFLQISIYYYKHNISNSCNISCFYCYLLFCCVVFSFALTCLNFVFLRLFFCFA